MKKDLEVQAVYCMSNFGGIEVHLAFEDGDRCMYWRYNFGEPEKWHKAKIYDTAKDRCYFRAGNMRVYLDQVIRV